MGVGGSDLDDDGDDHGTALGALVHELPQGRTGPALEGLEVGGALLVQLAISRSREYKADYSGAKTIGQPLVLASALEKLEVANRRRPITFGSPASQSLFIVNPFSGGAFVRIFSTHPPIQERIARLRDLAQGVDRY